MKIRFTRGYFGFIVIPTFRIKYFSSSKYLEISFIFLVWRLSLYIKQIVKNKMVMVCLSHGEKCDEKGYKSKVEIKNIIFCCEDGFIQSLKDFIDALK